MPLCCRTKRASWCGRACHEIPARAIGSHFGNEIREPTLSRVGYSVIDTHAPQSQLQTMRKLLAILYGHQPSRSSAFMAGVGRLGNPAPRVTINVYLDYVAERQGRMRTSASAAFVQGARHFEHAADLVEAK